MKAAERDELLVRLDERTRNIYKLTEAQEAHLGKINSHLEDHSRRITVTETLQKERHKPDKKTIGGYITGAVAIAVALWKAFTGSP